MRIQLFQIHNNKLEIVPETLTIKEFREIWQRDKSKEKSQALDDLAWIYWMGDYQSPYLSLGTEERSKEVINDILVNKKYKPDTLVKEGLNRYDSAQETITMKNLKSVREAANRIRDFFNKPDILEITNNNGTPLYKPKDITNAIKEYVSVMNSIDDWEKKVRSEESISGEVIRGGGSAGDFEDPEKCDYLKGIDN